MDLISTFNTMPVIITTRRRQARKHKKKRINKKWLKRYGIITIEVQEHDKVLVIDGKLYMTESAYWKIRKMIQEESNGSRQM